MSDHLIIIGKLITKERLRLGISKKKLTTDLQLPSKYLDLIENGEFDEHQHNSLVTRYLRLYLDYLGLNTEEILLSYKESFLEPREIKHKSLPFKYKYFNKKLIFKLICVFIFLFILFYKIEQNHQKKTKLYLSNETKSFYR